MPKHAPKGPIKARDGENLSTPKPIHRLCTAHSPRTGKPCKKYPIAGAVVCRMHGGAAPQVKRKALERLMELQDRAIDRMASLMHQETYPSTAYAASRDILDRTMGKPTESVQVEQSGSLEIRWLVNGEGDE